MKTTESWSWKSALIPLGNNKPYGILICIPIELMQTVNYTNQEKGRRMMRKFFISMTVILAVELVLGGCGTSNDMSNDAVSTSETAAATAPAAEDTAPASDTMADFYEEQLENQYEEAERWAKAPNDMDTMETPVTEPTLVPAPVKLNLRNQIFTRVSAFSEGFAWVQYLDDNAQTVTSVINTNGDVIYTPEHPVDYFSDFRDGYAFYLYTAENNGQDKSIDNVVSCIIDTNGNVTYTSQNDGMKVIIAYGDGHFLTLEHISTFDTEEWNFGSLDKKGNVLIDFDEYNNEIIDFSRSYELTDDYYEGIWGDFLSSFVYLEEGMFDLISGNNRVLYNVRENRWFEYYIGSSIVFQGVFQDGYLIAHTYNMWRTYVETINTNGEEAKFDALQDGLDATKYPFVSGYSEGVAFCGNAYYDINGNIQISFPQYESRKIGGGTFNQGFAPLYVEGADGKDYFTIIDLEGNELFAPVLGFPDDSLSEGYLVVQQNSGCALFDVQGRKVLETPYTIVGGMEERSYFVDSHKSHTSFKVSNGYFIGCKEGSNVPTVFIGVDGSYIGQ